MSTDLRTLDAVGQAELVRTAQVHPTELVDAAIERIEALDPEINAVVDRRFEEARAGAGDAPDGPLRGVPFLLKGIGATQAGMPYHEANRALAAAGHRSGADTVLGARFRAAGLVTLGVSNLPEMGTMPATQPAAFGPTRNPWDPERSPAGSSGGAGAAVAAGMVPVAHANDGGGSTRLPASWCGLVGLKTTRGRMPKPDSTSRLVSELVVSRSVRDTAAVLDATHGAVPADLYHLPPPDRPFGDELGAPVEPLRIGLLTDGGGIDVDDHAVAAAERGASLLESMGHTVEPVGPDVLLGGDARVNGEMWMAGIAGRVTMLAELVGRELGPDDVEPYNWTAAQRGASTTAAEWAVLEERRQAWSRTVVDWLSQWDVLVTPTSGCAPLTTAELEPPADAPWRAGRTYARVGVFTLPFNVTGQPAISLPLHWTDEGLPVGTQLVAGMGGEALLLRLAAALEEAEPWAHRYPAGPDLP